jgi:uncharacterized cupin superfamily protein
VPHSKSNKSPFQREYFHEVRLGLGHVITTTMTHPPPKIINVFDAPDEPNDVSSVELATQFDLDRISIRHVTFPQSQKTLEVPILSKINLMCYVIAGTGTLSMGSENANGKQDDCFSFVASELTHSLSFTLTAVSDKLSLLIVSDVTPRDQFIAVSNYH